MLTGVVNFRDIGGHRTADGATVREGVIYRAAHFGAATPEDVALLDQLNVRLFVDFRGPGDIEADGHNVMPPGARLVSIPMFDPAGATDIRAILQTASPAEIEAAFGNGRAHDSMVRGAVALVTQADRLTGYARMLQVLIDADTPAVIHCSAGKDRTGWGATLMLLLLGVPEEQVVEHYLESNRHHRSRGVRTASPVDPELLRPFVEVRAEYAQASLDAMHATWGDIHAYVRDGLGIADADVERFRTRLLS